MYAPHAARAPRYGPGPALPWQLPPLPLLVLSHPRWAAATAAGRAAGPLAAEIRETQAGLSALATAYHTVATGPTPGQLKASRAYESACSRYSCSPWPHPSSALLAQLHGFAVDWATRHGSASLATYCSSLVAAARRRGYRVSGDAAASLHRLVRGLCRQFPHAPRRATPMRDADLVLVRHLAADARRGDLYALAWTAQLLLMSATIARVGEVTGTALRWSRLSVSGGELRVLLVLRKSRKSLVSLEHDTVTAIPPSDARLDATAAILAYARAVGARVGVDETVVFPHRARDGTVTTHDPARRWNDDFRALCAAARLPPPPAHQRRTSHGLRRGRATESRERGGARDDVMIVGGWASLEGFAPYDESGAAASRALGAVAVRSR